MLAIFLCIGASVLLVLDAQQSDPNLLTTIPQSQTTKQPIPNTTTVEPQSKFIHTI